MSFEIKGLNKALANLDKYSREVQSEVKIAVRDSTNDVRNKAVNNAPVNKKIGLGGNLRRGITASNRGYEGAVKARADYAAFVEFGTGRRGASSGVTPAINYRYGGKAGMRAQPYMWPAAEAARPAFFAALKRALKK